MAAGEWEAWCSQASIYVWARFHDVRLAGSVGCQLWTMTALYRAGSSGGSTGNSGGNGYSGQPSPSFYDTGSTEAAVWKTLSPGDPPGATLYLGASPLVPSTPACQASQLGTHVMLGAAITWQ